MSPQSLADVATFVRSEYGLPVLGEVPDCPNFWSRAELAHSVRGLSTPIVDRASGEVRYGEVPERAVVVSGGRQDPRSPGISVYAAVIVKYADEGTRGKTAINDLVRDLRQ